MTWLVLFFSQNAQKLRFTGLSSLKNGIRFKNEAATGSGSPSAGKKPCPARRHQAGFLRVIREEETPRETEQLPVKALFRVALADTGNQDAGLIGQRRRAEARRCPGTVLRRALDMHRRGESTMFSYSSEKALR